MYKECMTKSSAARQREIASAIFAVLQAHPLSSITVIKLCEKANVPRKAFYRYFESKEDIIAFLLDETATEYDLKEPLPAEMTVSAKLAHFFDYWYSKKDLLILLKANSLDGMLPLQLTTQLMSSHVGARNVTHSGDPVLYRAAALFTVSGLYALLADWRDSGFAKSSAEMGAIAEALLMQPLFHKAIF